jgi:hypothetical protein
MRKIDRVLQIVALTGVIGSTLAQEVSIPAPGLNDAIRGALGKPGGPLNERDLLT